jgi:UDP-2,3-diacylglucosamine hydrolase
MLTTLIISDLHLTNVEGDKVNFFKKFCETHASKADQLFILGDLFNTWLGDDVSLSSHKAIISSLKELTKETKVFVMVGNRDFLLSHNFEAETGCMLINEPYQLEQNSKRFLLIHGDSLCTDDIN